MLVFTRVLSECVWKEPEGKKGGGKSVWDKGSGDVWVFLGGLAAPAKKKLGLTDKIVGTLFLFHYCFGK